MHIMAVWRYLSNAEVSSMSMAVFVTFLRVAVDALVFSRIREAEVS